MDSSAGTFLLEYKCHTEGYRFFLNMQKFISTHVFIYTTKQKLSPSRNKRNLLFKKLTFWVRVRVQWVVYLFALHTTVLGLIFGTPVGSLSTARKTPNTEPGIS